MPQRLVIYYKVKTIILCSILFVITSNCSIIENVISNHQNHFRACTKHLLDSTLRPKCLNSKNEEFSCAGEARGGNWNPKISWFIRCVAEKIIEKGFQIPVYIVHDFNPIRYSHITTQLEAVGIKNESVTWVTGFRANNISDEDKKKFLSTSRDSGEELAKCKEVMPARTCSGNIICFINIL